MGKTEIISKAVIDPFSFEIVVILPVKEAA